jgi:tetrahydromethanopterin S-methyltransferase subunit G
LRGRDGFIPPLLLQYRFFARVQAVTVQTPFYAARHMMESTVRSAKALLAENGGAWLSTELLVALLALAGTLTGSFTGILVANKLVNYRLEQLEKKVEKHNNLVERIAMAENDIKIINHRIDDVEKLIDIEKRLE